MLCVDDENNLIGENLHNNFFELQLILILIEFFD